MVKIITKEIPFEESLKTKLEFICSFCNTKPKFINGSIRKIEKTNLSYIEPFKATKDIVSKMAFIIVDEVHANIFDINNSRLSKDIEKYFKMYSLKERNKVKFITLDLYKPYYKLLKGLFKNAILIPDRFHIDLQVRNALDKTRIKLCVKSNPNYRKLKKNWKLILKDKHNLDKENKKYQKCFRKEMTEFDIVKYLIKPLKIWNNIFIMLLTMNIQMALQKA